MTRTAKKLLIVIPAIFIVTVFISAIVNHPHVKNANVYPIYDYLDIQTKIHHRMYGLVVDIGSRYQNSPEDIKALIGYVERLHKEVIVLGNSNKLAKIATSVEDPESLQWTVGQLKLVMQPINELKNGDAKIIVLIMIKEIEYLHGSVGFIAGEKMEEAMVRVKDFTKRFQR